MLLMFCIYMLCDTYFNLAFVTTRLAFKQQIFVANSLFVFLLMLLLLINLMLILVLLLHLKFLLVPLLLTPSIHHHPDLLHLMIRQQQEGPLPKW